MPTVSTICRQYADSINNIFYVIKNVTVLFSTDTIQKHPPEVFCKKGVLRNYAKIHRKTPVPESLF